ncbi:MAG TPA: transcription/translation regulatory transformer protein RfaH [Burkholderiales bacterium]|nr:transcription/translation regulatory transformer protein RfaH [Burkholderiales bacterium]
MRGKLFYRFEIVSSGNKEWYLVYAKPRQEKVAQRNLERQGYRTYLPLVSQARRRNGRRVAVIGPMFPRYLFICLDRGSDDWGPIRSSRGVVSLVRFGSAAAKVPDSLIAALNARENESGLQALPPEEYRSGSRVRIMEGSFSGYQAVFLAKTGHDRVVLLLDILGKHTRATVRADAIEPGD